MGVHPFCLLLKKMVKAKALVRVQSAIFYQYMCKRASIQSLRTSYMKYGARLVVRLRDFVTP